VRFTKPALSLDQQADLLIERGMGGAREAFLQPIGKAGELIGRDGEPAGHGVTAARDEQPGGARGDDRSA
jgi:hypothetical protein